MDGIKAVVEGEFIGVYEYEIKGNQYRKVAIGDRMTFSRVEITADSTFKPNGAKPGDQVRLVCQLRPDGYKLKLRAVKIEAN